MASTPALSSLDPAIAALEQLQTSGTGWTAAPASGINNTIFIDPSASSPGNGTLAHPFSSWNFVTWNAGTTYLQKAGTTFTGVVDVTGSGSSAHPIILGSYGNGAAPTIQGTVLFDNAHYAAMTAFNVTQSPFSGVIIRDGSSNIEVAGNTISKSAIGVYIAPGGGSDLIQGNNISGSTYFGVAIGQANNAAGHETYIAGNAIHDNGSHGIEINGDRYVVEYNIVYNNGLTVPGSSGIHTYAANASQDAGNYNTIQYNTIFGTHDALTQDGNGIELDQFTHNNTVQNNLAYQNDGAGVIVFDSYDNTVQNNTLLGNERDPGHTHLMRGELVLATSDLTNYDLSYGNVVSHNTAIANNSNAFAIYVDALTSKNAETIDGNSFVGATGGQVYDLAGTSGSNVATWNAFDGGGDTFGFTPDNAAPATTTQYDSQFGSAEMSVNGVQLDIVSWSPAGGLVSYWA